MRSLSGSTRSLRAVGCRVNERGRSPTAPILDAGVGIEDLRLMIAGARRCRARLRPHRSTGSRCLVSAKGNEVAVNWPSAVGVAQRRLFRSIRRGAGDVRHDGIEHLTVSFVGIEALVEKIAKEAAALGAAERVGVFRRCGRVGRVA